MLSVLIPVFNYDVCGLVKALQSQLFAMNRPYEIRVYDDYSTNETLKDRNEEVKKIPGVVYKKLPQNLGFCKIRNLLAEQARYDLLLFLDSDVEIIDEHFIENYLEIADDETVFCGGMVYVDKPPNSELYLKWKHGKVREEALPAVRNKAAHRTFWAGNFLISKKIFLAARFDDGSNNYGYNDTMFGYKLMVQNVPVVHIDNALLHRGLMPAEKFIRRSMEAVENLLFFEQQDYIQPSFYTFIKVFRYYGFLKKTGLGKLYLHYYQRNRNNWMKNLKSSRPNLRYLDQLKLGKLLALKLLIKI